MTYPEPELPSRYVGEGFRVEPEFRQASGSPESHVDEDEPLRYTPGTVHALPAGPSSPARAVTAAELDGAFDDPAQGEPGRDRFGVHAVWELVLLVACAGMAYALIATHTHPFSGGNLKTLMAGTAIFGGLGLAASLSIRTSAPNLAIGPIAVLSGLYFADHQPTGFYQAAGIAVLIALACGLAIALVTVIFHVPAWAASLAGAFAALVWATHLPNAVELLKRYDIGGQAYYWFGTFAVLSFAGGLLGALRPVRRRIGAYRAVTDPADRRSASAGLVAGLAILVSSLIAGVVGIAAAALSGGAVASDGFVQTGVGFGIALFGGVSAFGRRGGILGTLLATVLFGLADQWTTVHAWRGATVTLIAIALGVGVLVTRMVESLGRPMRNAPADELTTPLSWLGRQQGSWAGQPLEPTVPDAADPRWSAR